MSKQLDMIKAGAFSVYKQAGVPEQNWESIFHRAMLKRAGVKEFASKAWTGLKNMGSNLDKEIKKEPQTSHARKWIADYEKSKIKPTPIPAEKVLPSLNPPGPAKPLDFSSLLPKAQLPLRKNK